MVIGVTLLLSVGVLLIAYTGKGAVYFGFLKYIPGGDKTGHVVLLGLLTLSVSWLLSYRGIMVKRIKIYYGMVFVAVFITMEEIAQMFSPFRSLDMLDLLCNYVGIFSAGLWMSWCENKNNMPTDIESDVGRQD